MSDQDDDEDEIDILEQEIAREVEEAFADVPYPGDDRLLGYPNYWENEEILKAFRGKHWKGLSPDFLREQRLSLGALSPGAFRFYLPACMIGALIHSDETDSLWEIVFYNVTPPSSSKSDRMDHFCACIAPLNARQKAVVRRYVEIYVQIESSYEEPGKDRAFVFWRRLTDLEPKGEEPRDQESALWNIWRAMGWEEAAEQKAREDAILEQEIAHEVEKAFATVAPPEEDGSPSSLAQWKKVPEAFRGKHWKDLSPMLVHEHKHDLKYVSPEAFRFFLPAYLLAAFVHADETGELRDQLFYNLMPPREKGYWMDWFLANVNALDARQKAVVRRFMELWAKTATCYPEAVKERGISFWRQVTDTPSAAGVKPESTGESHG